MSSPWAQLLLSLSETLFAPRNLHCLMSSWIFYEQPWKLFFLPEWRNILTLTLSKKGCRPKAWAAWNIVMTKARSLVAYKQWSKMRPLECSCAAAAVTRNCPLNQQTLLCCSWKSPNNDGSWADTPTPQSPFAH